MPQSPCDDNQKDALFSWLHAYYAHLAFARFGSENSVCRVSLMTTYDYTHTYIYIYMCVYIYNIYVYIYIIYYIYICVYIYKLHKKMTKTDINVHGYFVCENNFLIFLQIKYSY